MQKSRYSESARSRVTNGRPSRKHSASAQMNPVAFNRKLKKIKDEMEIIDPDTLLLKVDPSIDSTKTIEQIQKYYALINNEISSYYHQEQEKAELTKKNLELTKQVEEMVKPKMNNYLEEFHEEKQQDKNEKTQSSRKKCSCQKKDNKPVIDYKVKLRSLQKDIVYTYQDFNNTKSRNNRLMEELDELRKQVIQKDKHLKELKEKLEEEEKEYYQQKKEIEKTLDNKDEAELLEKIKKSKKLLEKANQEMVEKIKETDQFLTQKQAKKKCLDFEASQLESLHKKLEESNQKELRNFNEKYKDDIEKVKNFDESSKIIDMLDKEKIQSLEDMLKEMFNETKTENIQSFVDYFIKSCEEYKAFQDSIKDVSETVSKLEKEVDELEYITDFCEQNLEVVNENHLNEEEKKEVDNLKICSEKFIEVQYLAIYKAYQEFTKEIKETILKYRPEYKDNPEVENNFLKFFICYLNDSLEQLKLIAKMNKKKGSKPARDIFDFNKWDSKWEKADKIKENVRKEYERSGPGNARLNFKLIRSMVDDVLLKGEKLK